MAEKKGVTTPDGSSSRPIQGNEEPKQNHEYNLRKEILEMLTQRRIRPEIARIALTQSIQRDLKEIREELDLIQKEIEEDEESSSSSEEEEEEHQPRGKAHV